MTSMTMTRESVTVIECSECGGHFERVAIDLARSDCGNEVSLSHDIAPNLEWDERLAWDREGRLGYTTVEWGE